MAMTTRTKRDNAKARMQAEAEGHAQVAATKTSVKKTKKLQKLQEKCTYLLSCLRSCGLLLSKSVATH